MIDAMNSMPKFATWGFNSINPGIVDITMSDIKVPRLTLAQRVASIVAGIALGALVGAAIGGVPGFIIGVVTGALIGTTIAIINTIAKKSMFISVPYLNKQRDHSSEKSEFRAPQEVRDLIFNSVIFDKNNSLAKLRCNISDKVMLFPVVMNSQEEDVDTDVDVDVDTYELKELYDSDRNDSKQKIKLNTPVSKSILQAAKNAIFTMNKMLENLSYHSFSESFQPSDNSTTRLEDAKRRIIEGKNVLQDKHKIVELQYNSASLETNEIYAVAYYISRQFSPHIRLINTIKEKILTALEKEGINNNFFKSLQIQLWAQNARNQFIPEEDTLMNKFIDMDDINMNDMQPEVNANPNNNSQSST